MSPITPVPKDGELYAFHSLFHQDWKHLQHNKFRKKFLEEIFPLFLIHPFDPTLRNHALGGKYLNCRSIDITGDIRAIYTTTEQNITVFVRIGTHSHLYG